MRGQIEQTPNFLNIIILSPLNYTIHHLIFRTDFTLRWLLLGNNEEDPMHLLWSVVRKVACNTHKRLIFPELYPNERIRSGNSSGDSFA
jgi:hypothetical protein